MDRNTSSGAAALLDAGQLHRAFPFLLRLDDALRIVDAGASVRKICPQAVPRAALLELFEVRRPLRHASVADWTSTPGVMCTLRGRHQPELHLRGSAERLADGTLALLLAPVLSSMAQMQALGLSFDDFALHDAAGDLLLMASAMQMSAADALQLAVRLEVRTAQLDTALDLSDSALLYFDVQGRLLQSNAAAGALLDWPAHKRVGTDLVAVQARLATRLEAGTPACAMLVEAAMLPPGERLRVVFALPQPVVFEIGMRSTSDGGCVYTLRDVTREIEIDRMKSEFLSTAAHELRTPLTSIVGFSELLLHGSFDAACQRDLLGTVYAQALALERIVDDLLDLGRIEARRNADFRREPLSLMAQLRTAAEAFTVPGDARRVVLELDASDTTVSADAHQLQRVLANLLGNAFKYSPGGGEVRLVLHAPRGGTVAFEVIDCGIGMDEAQLAQAFDRFYRADVSGAIPGTGLGLSLVHEIVTLHGGEVTLASRSGEGTHATVRLPLADMAGANSMTF